MSARVKKGLFFTIAASVLFGISPIITAWASESIGDAMTLWQMANDTGAAYKSEWVEG